MNDITKKAANTIVHGIDLPPDLFLGLPNLSFVGNQETYISNHRGIASFSPTEIWIFTQKQQIQIKGRELLIFSYSKDEILIKGYITSVAFV